MKWARGGCVVVAIAMMLASGCTPSEAPESDTTANGRPNSQEAAETGNVAATSDNQRSATAQATEIAARPPADWTLPAGQQSPDPSPEEGDGTPREVAKTPESADTDPAAEPKEPRPSTKPDPTATPKDTPPADTPPADTPPADTPPAQPASSPGTGPELVAPRQSKSQDSTETPILIPREQLFGNPKRAAARISPDGKFLSYLAPVDGVLNVWVAPIDDLEAARPVTQDKDRGIRSYFWAYTNKHILYSQDEKGDEDFHIYAVDLTTDEIKDLTPLEDIRAQIQEVSEKFPEEILVGINDRDQHQLHDIYRVNIVSGERELVQLNPGFLGFLTDDDYQVRLAVTITPDAGQKMLLPDGEQWKEWITVNSEDTMTTSPIGFTKGGERLYLLDSRGRDTAALMEVELGGEGGEVLAENERADISGVITHPTEKHVQAVTYTYARREWKILDESIADDLEYLQGVTDGELQIVSRTLDDSRWIVAYLMDDGPIRYYVYDREPKKTEFLFSNNPDLESLPLVKMHPEVIKARDGMNLVSYLSLPANSNDDSSARPAEPLPMVLLVHGGPWARDSWGYDPLHQLLANRGYAVLSVNYRGSTGFGKEFINAADREWAAAMHNDLEDAVQWAIKEGIAQPDKVAIMGGSYGGYATLVGLTFTPELFTCGVDIVGPSNLVTLLDNPPPYWMPFMPVMKRRVGDNSTDEGREFLMSRSPLSRVDKIKRPLLIGQGKHDPRVKQAESDQIVEAMNERKIPVTYMLFLEEGHGFAKPENRMAFFSVTEAFLAEYLGGRYQPIGKAFEGAVFEVPSGKEDVPGLAAALSEQE